jgi:hypothetical protein
MIVEAVEEIPLALNTVRKLGTALYTHQKKQEEAEDAEKAVDYLQEQGVLKDD